MKPFAPPRTGSICHFCMQAGRRPQLASSSLASRVSQTQRSITVASSVSSKRPRHHQTAPGTSPSHTWRRLKTDLPSAPIGQELSQQELASINNKVQELANAVLEHPGVPDEKAVTSALSQYLDSSSVLLLSKPSVSKQPATSPDKTATSALLSSVKKRPQDAHLTPKDVLANMSTRAQDMVRHGPVFISPGILKLYVQLQTALGRPESFPAVFDLYRHKPVPQPTQSHPISYSNPNPDKPAAAVDPYVAETAIDAAIARRDMPLALATIEATYCTTAYKRSKFLRSALFPLAGLVLTPPAAYTLATRFSLLQTTMDPQMATNVAMAGILTYTTAVATVGYVALTTANDQMVRITWATGMPLWERWVREEERGAFDKIAQAWGFTSRDKWGEEEGEEWEGLKEFTGLRGMVLDRVELMDGME